MSIRLRLTLLYTGILALTLIIFGAALYTIQARSTLDALKRDLVRSSDRFSAAVMWAYTRPVLPLPEPNSQPPARFEIFTGAPDFEGVRER